MSDNDKKGLTDLISEHPVIKILTDIFLTSSTGVVGGAIIDIIEDRKPKDWDVVGWNSNHFKKITDSGFKFENDTKTAITYKKEEIILQLLKIRREDFDFKISQTIFYLKGKVLHIDKDSFDNKILIPVSYEKRGQVMATLKRIPHYMKKGYTIPEVTYLSLLNTLSKAEKTYS